MKTSNKFTLSRVVLAPVIFILYFLPMWTGHFAAASVIIMIPLLAFMEFTDYLDGHFARKHNEVSDFGKLFDPFADVIVHLTTFVCFMFSMNEANLPMHGYVPPVVFILVMYREMTMTFIRMVAAKKGTAIAARKGGKFKTVMYVAAGFYALFLETLVRLNVMPSCFNILYVISVAVFIVCVICSYVSFFDYLKNFGQILKDQI